MTGPEVVLALVLVVLVVSGVAAAVGRRPVHRRRRRAALETLARELGWQLHPTHDYSLRAHGGFDLFRRWPCGHSFNTLLGRLNVGGRTYAVQMGDYDRGHARRVAADTTDHASYLLVLLPFPRLPDVDIRREDLLDKTTDAVGLDDVDFESDALSRMYHVRSSDRRFVYDLVHPRMMEFLLGVRAPTVQIRERLMLLTDGWSLWEPEGFRRKLWWLREFLELWPEHLVREVESTDGGGGGPA